MIAIITACGTLTHSSYRRGSHPRWLGSQFHNAQFQSSGIPRRTHWLRKDRFGNGVYAIWSFMQVTRLLLLTYGTKASGVTTALPEAPCLCELSFRSLGSLINDNNSSLRWRRSTEVEDLHRLGLKTRSPFGISLLSRFYEPQNVPHGTLHFHESHSDAAFKTEKRAGILSHLCKSHTDAAWCPLSSKEVCYPANKIL